MEKKGIFENEDLNLMIELFEKYSDNLNENKDYKKYCNRLSEITELVEKLPKEQMSLFEEADQLYCLTSNYEKCLFYYLGLQKGIGIGEIK
ncbi:MAG: hypothetical protein Q4G05_00125 [Clostridia bacterium]|nr:hypothetical protein [Clostridia bacterium]